MHGTMISELLARWVRPSGSEIVMVLVERGWYSNILSENLHLQLGRRGYEVLP